MTDELEVADAQAKELLKLIEEESAAKKAEEEAAAAAEPEADDELVSIWQHMASLIE